MFSSIRFDDKETEMGGDSSRSINIKRQGGDSSRSIMIKRRFEVDYQVLWMLVVQKYVFINQI